MSARARRTTTLGGKIADPAAAGVFLLGSGVTRAGLAPRVGLVQSFHMKLNHFPFFRFRDGLTNDIVRGVAEGLAVRSTFSFGNRNCLDESPVGMD